jgi:hypothetical protein
MSDLTTVAIDLARLLYTRSPKKHAEAFRHFHPDAIFSDPLVTVRTRQDISVQFDAFEKVFGKVQLDIHGAGEHVHQWPGYSDKGTPFDAHEANRYVVIDSTQYYTFILFPFGALPVRVSTVFQFTPFTQTDSDIGELASEPDMEGVKWLVTRHEDSWALAETVSAILPGSLRAGLHRVKGMWSWGFTRALEVLVGQKGGKSDGGMLETDGVKAA